MQGDSICKETVCIRRQRKRQRKRQRRRHTKGDSERDRKGDTQKETEKETEKETVDCLPLYLGGVYTARHHLSLGPQFHNEVHRHIFLYLLVSLLSVFFLFVCLFAALLLLSPKETLPASPLCLLSLKRQLV